MSSSFWCIVFLNSNLTWWCVWVCIARKYIVKETLPLRFCLQVFICIKPFLGIFVFKSIFSKHILRCLKLRNINPYALIYDNIFCPYVGKTILVINLEITYSSKKVFVCLDISTKTYWRTNFWRARWYWYLRYAAFYFLFDVDNDLAKVFYTFHIYLFLCFERHILFYFNLKFVFSSVDMTSSW